jgi:hypothetical protein
MDGMDPMDPMERMDFMDGRSFMAMGGAALPCPS